MQRTHRTLVAAACGVCGLAGGLYAFAADEKAKLPDPKALERAQQTVRMLDDVYKTAIVLMTDKYVNKESDFSAASAAVALFEAMNKKGWHDVQLVDLTGEPYNEKNVPSDDFEKAAAKQLKAGKDYFEAVEQKNGAPYLRAVTAVPVVMEKCKMCHPHYKDAKKGEAIGMLSYTLKIQ